MRGDPVNNYANVHLDSRKCTKAEINSCVTFPSKVHASQFSTKTQMTCSSKNVQRDICLAGIKVPSCRLGMVNNVYNILSLSPYHRSLQYTLNIFSCLAKVMLKWARFDFFGKNIITNYFQKILLLQIESYYISIFSDKVYSKYTYSQMNDTG